MLGLASGLGLITARPLGDRSLGGGSTSLFASRGRRIYDSKADWAWAGRIWVDIAILGLSRRYLSGSGEWTEAASDSWLTFVRLISAGRGHVWSEC